MWNGGAPEQLTFDGEHASVQVGLAGEFVWTEIGAGVWTARYDDVAPLLMRGIRRTGAYRGDQRVVSRRYAARILTAVHDFVVGVKGEGFFGTARSARELSDAVGECVAQQIASGKDVTAVTVTGAGDFHAGLNAPTEAGGGFIMPLVPERTAAMTAAEWAAELAAYQTAAAIHKEQSEQARATCLPGELEELEWSSPGMVLASGLLSPAACSLEYFCAAEVHQPRALGSFSCHL